MDAESDEFFEGRFNISQLDIHGGHRIRDHIGSKTFIDGISRREPDSVIGC